MAQFLHLLSRRFSYPTIQVLFAIILKNYVIERTMDSRFTNTYRPDAIPSVERGWNIINPEPRQSRNRTANCRNKNDERASGKRMSFPECRIRRIAGGIEQRDRRRRGAECTCTMFYRGIAPRTNVAPSFGRSAVEILAISLQCRDISAHVTWTCEHARTCCMCCVRGCTRVREIRGCPAASSIYPPGPPRRMA